MYFVEIYAFFTNAKIIICFWKKMSTLFMYFLYYFLLFFLLRKA